MIALATLLFATISPPKVVYVGPYTAEPKFENAFDEASARCGVKQRVQRRYAIVRYEPANPGERAKQEEEIAGVAHRTGHVGSEADHPVVYGVIRAMMQSRTFVQFETSATATEFRCVQDWMSSQGFAPVAKDQQLPPELRD